MGWGDGPRLRTQLRDCGLSRSVQARYSPCRAVAAKGTLSMSKPEVASDFVDIDHLGINVTDLSRSEAWYQEVLGFEVLHRWKTTTLVGLGNVKLGLFWRPDAKPIPDLDSLICMQHLAFLVDGFRFMQTRQKLIDKGIDVVD